MASIFHRDLGARRPLSNYEVIAGEVPHLGKGYSVRKGHGAAKTETASWMLTLAIGALLALFFMDPFVYAMKKSDAIETYLYLHNYDGTAAVDGLVSSGMFTPEEIDVMNHKQNTDRDAFVSARQAEEKAGSIARYLDSMHNLRLGNYPQLDPIGKLRYLLFVRAGLMPPSEWSGLNPSVQ